jgi:hypothetical protein
MNGTGVTHNVRSVFHDRNTVKFGSKYGWTAYGGHSWGAGDGVLDELWKVQRGSAVKFAAASGKLYAGKVKVAKKIKANASMDSCYDLRGQGVCVVTCDERTRTADGVYHGKFMLRVTDIRRVKHR